MSVKKYTIEIDHDETQQILDAMTPKDRAQALRRGVHDLLYRRAYNRKTQQSLKEITALKKAASDRGMSVEQFIAEARRA